jgi:hypothetical protein
MKKVLLIMAVGLLTAVPLRAQIKLGVKAGYNLTDISVNKHIFERAISDKTGFFIGPTIQFSLPFIGWGIDVSALYDRRDGKVKETGETLKQKTIQVPINVRLGIGLGGVATVFAFAGPQLGFLIGDEEKKMRYGDWTLDDSQVSANIGGGIVLVDHLQLTVNYNFALGKTSEYKYTIDNIVESAKVKSNAWQMALTYYF